MDIDPVKVKAVREVVDGQQRLDALFRYIEGDFVVYSFHNEEIAGKRFKDLHSEQQTAILSYEVGADLLLNADDALVYDIFARINSYGLTLNEQEKRNAKYFGAFKQEVYRLGTKYLRFWKAHRVLSDHDIARMQEAKLVSELLIALLSGLQDKTKSINSFYKTHEGEFPQRRVLQSRFDAVMTFLDTNLGDSLQLTAFRRPPLFYSLFLAVADALFGVPKENGSVPGFPKTRLPEAAARRWTDTLDELTSALRMAVPLPQFAEFAAAAARQTDNLGPRRTRHNVLFRALVNSLE